MSEAPKICSPIWHEDPSPGYDMGTEKNIKYERIDIVEQLRTELAQVKKERDQYRDTLIESI